MKTHCQKKYQQVIVIILLLCFQIKTNFTKHYKVIVSINNKDEGHIDYSLLLLERIVQQEEEQIKLPQQQQKFQKELPDQEVLTINNNPIPEQINQESVQKDQLQDLVDHNIQEEIYLIDENKYNLIDQQVYRDETHLVKPEFNSGVFQTFQKQIFNLNDYPENYENRNALHAIRESAHQQFIFMRRFQTFDENYETNLSLNIIQNGLYFSKNIIYTFDFLIQFEQVITSIFFNFNVSVKSVKVDFKFVQNIQKEDTSNHIVEIKNFFKAIGNYFDKDSAKNISPLKYPHKLKQELSEQQFIETSQELYEGPLVMNKKNLTIPTNNQLTVKINQNQQIFKWKYQQDNPLTVFEQDVQKVNLFCVMNIDGIGRKFKYIDYQIPDENRTGNLRDDRNKSMFNECFETLKETIVCQISIDPKYSQIYYLKKPAHKKKDNYVHIVYYLSCQQNIKTRIIL